MDCWSSLFHLVSLSFARSAEADPSLSSHLSPTLLPSLFLPLAASSSPKPSREDTLSNIKKRSMKFLLSTFVLAGSLLSSVQGQVQSPVQVELNSSTIAFVEDPALLWSTYAPQLYFGIKPRLPKSLTSGLLWFGLNDWEGLQRELSSFLLPRPLASSSFLTRLASSSRYPPHHLLLSTSRIRSRILHLHVPHPSSRKHPETPRQSKQTASRHLLCQPQRRQGLGSESRDERRGGHEDEWDLVHLVGRGRRVEVG